MAMVEAAVVLEEMGRALLPGPYLSTVLLAGTAIDRAGNEAQKHRYLTAILNRITLAGALFLGIVAILPFVARIGANQLLGSASLLIVVGVVLDTVRQLESQMVMRNYSGFLS